MDDSDVIVETLASRYPVDDLTCTALMGAIVAPGPVPPSQCPRGSRSHYHRLKEPSHNHPHPPESHRAWSIVTRLVGDSNVR